MENEVAKKKQKKTEQISLRLTPEEKDFILSFGDDGAGASFSVAITNMIYVLSKNDELKKELETLIKMRIEIKELCESLTDVHNVLMTVAEETRHISMLSKKAIDVTTEIYKYSKNIRI